MIYSVLQRRRAALLDCDWDILQAAAPEEVSEASVQHSGRAKGTGRERDSGSAYADKLRRDVSAGAARLIAPKSSPSRQRGKARGNGAGVDHVLADDQAAFPGERYDGIANFRDAVGFLFTG